jgi:thioredoxin 1
MIYLGIFDFNKKRKISDKPTLFNDKWPDYVVTLDEKNITEFITKYPLSIVDFWASWCAPCREMAPRLRRLSKIYKGEIVFGKLDIQNNQDIAKEYKITGIPHLVFFKNGKKISSITGVKSIGDLKDTIDALLKKIK